MLTFPSTTGCSSPDGKLKPPTLPNFDFRSVFLSALRYSFPFSEIIRIASGDAVCDNFSMLGYFFDAVKNDANFYFCSFFQFLVICFFFL